MKPKFVTFTGVDANTDLERLKELSKRYPIEWGILYGGRLASNRYPPKEKILEALETDARFAAHLCGIYSKIVFSRTIEPIDLEDILGSSKFARIQVNAIEYPIPKLIDLAESLKRPIIMQTRNREFPKLAETTSHIDYTQKGLYFLHDLSGGRGLVPTSRPVQEPSMPFVGYAGGIGPDNVMAVLEDIKADDFWIDMESNIRTDDWLDLDKCEAVCKAIWGEST